MILHLIQTGGRRIADDPMCAGRFFFFGGGGWGWKKSAIKNVATLG